LTAPISFGTKAKSSAEEAEPTEPLEVDDIVALAPFMIDEPRST
jgi:hypothetical protein